MKWTIHELIKKAKNDNLIEEKIDLRSFLKTEYEDLVDIRDTFVFGEYDYYYDENVFVFNLHINTTLIMLCSITLKEIPVKLDFETQLNFSVNYIDDNTHIIEGITIDLNPYIFAEILIEKPMRVISKGAKIEFEDENVILTEEEKEEDNPFTKLKK
ncbi:MAG: YceD family protein [Candidatus Izemoplasmatales bacterium]